MVRSNLTRSTSASLVVYWPSILTFVATSSALIIWEVPSYAAPVIFTFEAEVASAFPMEAKTSLPFIVSPGDSIIATLTFEPSSTGPVYPQSTSMQFNIGGTVFETPEYEIEVANDELRRIDAAGRIADPNNTPDIDFNEIGDNIVASCRSGADLFCGTSAAASDLLFRPHLVLSGPVSLVSSNDLPADPNIWNAFPLREMSLLFRDANTGNDIYYIGAYVGQVREAKRRRKGGENGSELFIDIPARVG